MDGDPPQEQTIRLLRASDLSQRFEGAGLLFGHLSMEDLGARHRPLEGALVLIAEFDDEIVGAIAVSRRKETLHIEYLSVNRAVDRVPGLRVGMPLLRPAEILAQDVGGHALTLESVNDPRTIAFYRQAGFRESGPPFAEGGWTVLHPMTKALPPPP